MNSRIVADSRVHETTERIREISPRLKARIAGVLYVIGVLTAVFAEFLAPGRLGIAAAILIPVLCYAAVTVLLYGIFKPVDRTMSLLALSFGLAGLACEALRMHVRGVNIGMVFHGLFCLVIGYLIFRSNFLPRILGAPMAFAGLVWLIYLSPPLARLVSPYNSAIGILGEALPMLWLLVMGVNAQRWKEQAGAAEGLR
ncbi:MAG: DUF4386 domain-containing protein [Silvibacterium sp.]